jgi:phosphoglycolate phosphatase
MSGNQVIATLYPELNEKEIREVLEYYRKIFTASAEAGLALFPEVRETLVTLKEHGLTLAVATSKSRNGLEHTLDQTDLRPYFRETLVSDEHEPKPDPAMIERIMELTDIAKDNTLMIGDSIFDIQMAQNAGVDSVAVTYGLASKEQLAEQHPTFFVNHFQDLLPIIL